MARAPESFDLDPQAPAKSGRGRIAVVETADVFVPQTIAEAADDARAGGRWSFWTKAFWSALAGFAGLWLASATYDFIVRLIQHSEILGFMALGLAILLAVSLIVIIARETAALMRLGSAAAMRAEAADVRRSGDGGAARHFLKRISRFYRADPTTARGRAALEGHAGEIIEGPDLVDLAERELLRDKDEQVRAAIAAAASRVAMVTTVSPRAWVDVGFVLAQSLMLISKVATLYSGRPGGLAVWRLAGRVVTHLAVTGGVAVATDVVGQFFGAGLLARVSSRLGEGVLNGVLTARVGLSAIAVCRPMPFHALPAPTLSDVAGSLLTPKADGEKSAG